MFRKLFWLSAFAGVGYVGYKFWRWTREQGKPAPFLTDALAGRLYETPPAPTGAAAQRPGEPPSAETPAQPRRIVTRVHKGAPPSATATPAATTTDPAAPAEPAAPTGAGLTFGPEIVGATDTPADAPPPAELDLAPLVSPEAAADGVDLAPLVSPEAEAGALILDGPLTNINSADEAALVALPGIGPALARRIIAYRDEHGPFASIDALDAIQGLGPRNIDEFRHLVTV